MTTDGHLKELLGAFFNAAYAAGQANVKHRLDSELALMKEARAFEAEIMKLATVTP